MPLGLERLDRRLCIRLARHLGDDTQRRNRLDTLTEYSGTPV
jgi:hypothetical protein